MVRLQYLFLSPLVVFEVPPAALLQQPLPVATALAACGSAGIAFRSRRTVTFSSAALVGLLIWSKVVADLLKMSGPDSAQLLIEFAAVLFFREASGVTLEFDKVDSGLGAKNDDLSEASRKALASWLQAQLSRQSKLALATVSLSIVLTTLAGITGIPNNQPVLSAALVLAAVITLLFLLTQGREPEGG